MRVGVRKVTSDRPISVLRLGRWEVKSDSPLFMRLAAVAVILVGALAAIAAGPSVLTGGVNGVIGGHPLSGGALVVAGVLVSLAVGWWGRRLSRA
jgi:hypothetical protein